MIKIRFIAAIDNKRGLAKNGRLPWDLPQDRKYFRDHIKNGPVAMGWNTFASNNFKPYGDGPNTVITRKDTEAVPGVWIVHNPREFLETNHNDIWVAGGGQIFKEALNYATELYLTRISGNYDCDVFFPEFEKDFELLHQEPIMQENGIIFQYEVWGRKQ